MTFDNDNSEPNIVYGRRNDFLQPGEQLTKAGN
jgi:hypothetical protein